MQSLSRSLSVFGFLCTMSGRSVSVRTQCEGAWYWLSGRTNIMYIVTNVQAHLEIQSPHNLSEGGSLWGNKASCCLGSTALTAHTHSQQPLSLSQMVQLNSCCHQSVVLTRSPNRARLVGNQILLTTRRMEACLGLNTLGRPQQDPLPKMTSHLMITSA